MINVTKLWRVVHSHNSLQLFYHLANATFLLGKLIKDQNKMICVNREKENEQR